MEPTSSRSGEQDGGLEPRPQRSQGTISATAPAFVPTIPLSTSTYSGTSNLSPYAAPFYPKNYFQYLPPPVIPEQIERVDKWKGNEEALDELRNAIHLLIIDPGRFEQLMPPLARKVASLISYEGCPLQPLIEEIISQSVYEGNFRYSGARMFSYFSRRSEPAFIDFQREFLSSLDGEHESLKRQGYLPLRHVVGFSLFLGELLMIMKDYNSTHLVPQLPRQIGRIIMHLLSNVSKDALVCCVQLLKLTGAVLEDSLPNMNEIFDRIDTISRDGNIPMNLVNMLQSVMNHRMSCWGQQRSSDSSGAGDSIDSIEESAITRLHDSELYEEAPYEDDRELLDEYEDLISSDQYWIGDRKMDDETASAFAQFMAETQASTSYARARARGHGSFARRN